MSSDVERELERTTALRGFRYGLHDFVAPVSYTHLTLPPICSV